MAAPPDICADCMRERPLGEPQGAPPEAPAAGQGFSGRTARGLIIGGAIVAAVIVAAPLLLLGAGFGSAGVIAGSWAAFMQGSAVASGSLFATCQSVAAVGGLSAATGLTATAAGAGVGGAVGLAADKIAEARQAQKDKKKRSKCRICGRAMP